jgi:hypothetical protein
MLLRPRRSLVPVAQEQGLQEQLAVGFRTADTDGHGTTLDSRPTCKFRAPRLLLFFTLRGLRQTPCALWTIKGLNFTSTRLKLRKFSFPHQLDFCTVVTRATVLGHGLAAVLQQLLFKAKSPMTIPTITVPTAVPTQMVPAAAVPVTALTRESTTTVPTMVVPTADPVKTTPVPTALTMATQAKATLTTMNLASTGAGDDGDGDGGADANSAAATVTVPTTAIQTEAPAAVGLTGTMLIEQTTTQAMPIAMR